MKEFDVTVEFCGRENSREIYTIDADDKDEAIETAKEMALDDISIAEIEDVTDYYTNLNKQRPIKFKTYLLNQTDIHGEEFTLLESRDVSWLIKIAEKISLQDTKKIEVIGVNENKSKYNCWSVMFTREF